MRVSQGIDMEQLPVSSGDIQSLDPRFSWPKNLVHRHVVHVEDA